MRLEARLTGLDRNEALIYMGYRGGELPADAEADILRCERVLLAEARPRVVWRRFGLTADGTLEGTGFRPEGRDIRALLSGCGAAILMAATLGGEVEALLRRTQLRRMADAVILDACASAAIENVCDNLCADIAGAVAPMYLTDRFSPGYGDLPLAQQADLCRVLDVSRRIGVTLTESGLMIPQKSVTAIIGISPVPVEKRSRGCAACNLFKTCTYRKEGKTCGAT